MAEQVNMGLAHLLNQTKKVAADADKCWLLTIPLSGQRFYVTSEEEGGKFGPDNIGMKFTNIYSELRDPQGTFLGVAKHPMFVTVGTGFTLDYIKKPTWWPKRDEGGLL